jgi:hypothetical protein
MAEPLEDQITGKISEVADLYHRLLIVVGGPGSGKTRALTVAQERVGGVLINANLELARRMLDLTERQRALQLPRLLAELVAAEHASVIFLDNIEMLFDTSLKQDPLRLLQGVARNKTIVAAWNGAISRGHLTYAAPDHPEYKRYPLQDLMVIARQVAA